MTLIGIAIGSSVSGHLPGMFQSLFSWMTLIGIAALWRTTRGSYKFQSLFSWMTLIGRLSGYVTPQKGAGSWFQSLFSWMTLIGQLPPDLAELPAEGFQSLFSWMTLIGSRSPAGSRRPFIGFQSLFSWMTLIGHVGLRVVSRNVKDRFQSLFSWMTLIGAAGPVEARPERSVSILVFLDDAHRR